MGRHLQECYLQGLRTALGRQGALRCEAHSFQIFASCSIFLVAVRRLVWTFTAKLFLGPTEELELRKASKAHPAIRTHAKHPSRWEFLAFARKTSHLFKEAFPTRDLSSFRPSKALKAAVFERKSAVSRPFGAQNRQETDP